MLRLNREYIAERTEQDRAVAAVPGASPRYDGPPGSHEWEQALRELERVVRERPGLSAPLPTWAGIGQQQQQQNAVHRLERLRRKKGSDQAEIDRLSKAVEAF